MPFPIARRFAMPAPSTPSSAPSNLVASTTDRAEILKRIRRHLPVASPRPELPDSAWIRYDDPAAQFATMLASVGGACERVADEEQAARLVAGLPVVVEAVRIDSDVPGVLASRRPETDAPPAQVASATGEVGPGDEASRPQPGHAGRPHDLADVDVAVVRGVVAVAENAAVWVTEQPGRHRAVYFLAQHVILVVPMAALVDTMHEGYRILAERFGIGQKPGFGLWISGPSKTADIEQSLVIGAHGARSLTVLLVG